MSEKKQLEIEIINDIGNFIDFYSEPLIDVLRFHANENKIISNIKLSEAAYVYNVARSYYIEAELYEVSTSDNISKEYNKMINMQTAAMWLNNFVDIVLQAEWFYKEIYKDTGISLTNSNFENILEKCNVNVVKNKTKNIYVKFLIDNDDIRRLRKNIVNAIKHRGAIYSKEIENTFIGNYSIEYRDSNGNIILDNSIFETKLMSYSDLRNIVNKDLKLCRSFFKYYVLSHKDTFPDFYK